MTLAPDTPQRPKRGPAPRDALGAGIGFGVVMYVMGALGIFDRISVLHAVELAIAFAAVQLAFGAVLRAAERRASRR